MLLSEPSSPHQLSALSATAQHTNINITCCFYLDLLPTSFSCSFPCHEKKKISHTLLFATFWQLTFLIIPSCKCIFHAVFRNFLLYSNDGGTDLLMETGCNTCLEHYDRSNIVNEMYGFFPSCIGAKLDIAVACAVIIICQQLLSLLRVSVQ